MSKDDSTPMNSSPPTSSAAGPEKKSSLSSVDWAKSSETSLMNRDALSGNAVVKAHASSEDLGPVELPRVNDATGFSSSLPLFVHEKLDLASNIDESLGVQGAHLERHTKGLVFGSLHEEDTVPNAVGDFLPDDEEELLAGIAEGFDFMNLNNTTEESEDFDLFSSGGGLEMDNDIQDGFGLYVNNSRSMNGFSGNGGAFHGASNGPGSVIGEHPFGEHPSRTLFVRNINSNVEDSELRALFEHFGAIRTLYTACKHRGFVMISYYDIRAARSAMRALQNKPLRRRKLDIHFSIPKDNPSDKDVNQGTLVVFNLDASVSNDDLRQIFGQYGEVKEIRETPHKRHHKFIEFYDVRAAEAALRALNRSDIAGKRIKLEPSRPGGARRSLMQQLSVDMEQEENRSYWQQSGSPVASSPPGHVSSWGQFGSPVENGPSRTLHPSTGNFVPGMNKPFPGFSVTLPPPVSVRVGTIGSHLGRTSSVDASSPSMPTSIVVPAHHAHSLPDHHNGTMPFYNPHGPVSTRGPVSSHTNFDGTEGLRLTRTTSGAGTDVSFFENAPGAIGVSNSGLGHVNSGPGGNTSLSGPQFLWGTSSSYHQSTNPHVWGTPPISHNLNSTGHGSVQPMGYTGSSARFISTGFNSHRYHVGSAPSGNPSNLERQLSYRMDSPETSFFGPSSLGPVSGVLGGNVLPVVDRNGTFPMSASLGSNGGFESSPPNFGMMLPYRRGYMFQTGMSGTSDGFAERARIRRTESNASQTDNKKQFQLDIDRILRGEDTRTTLMIKNIPNKYTSKMLLAAIDENHRGTYDFLYLPIDFKNKCNVGYAFINMTSPSHIVALYQAFNGKKWEKFNSEKVASLAYARIQGKAALVAHFQNSSLMNEDKRCRPILFHSEGPEAGAQEQSGTSADNRDRVPRELGGFMEVSNRGPLTGATGSGLEQISANSPEKTGN